MKENHQIEKDFYGFLRKELKNFTNPENGLITFRYYEEAEREEITVALIFWKFLRKRFSEDMKQKRSFIDFFVKGQSRIKRLNQYLEIVAMIEALPVTIWRKLLWRENIDFANYESCLRRLTPKQKEAIQDNYQDLFNDLPVTPRVLKKSWRDRVKVFFNVISTKKLLAETTEPEKRYLSKGAYAFSLLRLDFGFSLYPKGDNNDSKITNQKWSRFLSVKEHINDFVVNYEDGKYWWLYRTARSNYAFHPKRKVEMKSHVCPGFWATLVLHTMFWIVSPIALAITGTIIIQDGWTFWGLLPFVFALPMVSWGLVVMIRIVVKTIKRINSQNIIIKAIRTALIAIFLTVIVIALSAGFLYAFVHLLAILSKILGPLLALLSIFTFVFYVVYLITCIGEDNSWFDYDDIPAIIRFMLHGTVVAIVIVLFDKFLAAKLISLSILVGKLIWAWYTANVLVSTWLLMSIGFIVLFFHFFNLFLEDEKEFIKYIKTFQYSSGGFFLLTVGVFAISFNQLGYINFTEVGLVPSLMFILILSLFCSSLIILFQVNQSNITERDLTAHFLSNINPKLSGLRFKRYISVITESEWLNALRKEEKQKTIKEIQELAYFFFCDKIDYQIEFIRFLAVKGNLKILSTLEFHGLEILRKFSDEDRPAIITMMVGGYSISRIERTLQRRKRRNSKLIGKINNTWRILTAPPVYVGKGIVWIARKIGQFFLILKDIWSLFNERCPYISQSRYLD